MSNNAGNGDTGLAALLAKGRIRKVVCSFPRQADSYVFDGLYRAGRIELEVVPQGNLAERIRAAGAGIGAFFCPTGAGTLLAEGKETRHHLRRTHDLPGPAAPARPDLRVRYVIFRPGLSSLDGVTTRHRRPSGVRVQAP